MSWLEQIAPGLAAKRARAKAELAEARADEAFSRYIARESKALADIDEDEWSLVGSRRGAGEFSARETELLSQDYHYQMLQKAYVLARRNPHFRGILRAFVKYIAGRPVRFVPEDPNPEIAEFWREFEIRNKFRKRIKEIIYRTFRDGEVFIRRFVVNGKTDIRFLDPGNIKSPDDKANDPAYSFGIETQPGDVETVMAYHLRKSDGSTERIEAEKVIHIKIFADSDEKRGHSLLEPLLEVIQGYGRFVSDRIILNKVAAMYLFHIQQRYTPSSALPDRGSLVNTDGYGRRKHHPLPPGSTIVTDKETDINAISPNLRAEGAQEDGRAILLQLAVGSGLADFLTSGDASKANFASTMVSEGPMVKEFVDWEEFFEEDLKGLFRAVIREGISAGLIARARETEQEIVDTSLEVDVQWPEIVARDMKKEAEAFQIQRGMGIVSKQTVSSRSGYDWKSEEQYIAGEGGVPEPASKRPPGEEPEEETTEAMVRELRALRHELKETDSGNGKICEHKLVYEGGREAIRRW